MMEGMNQMGQEEYIWAMRTTLYRETSDSELWKHRRSHTPHASRMSLKKSKSNLAQEVGETQTRTMASLVPDEVINNVDDYSHRKYDACFIFGDVSGFTELCEKYTKIGLSGPSRMTQVLNKYLGSMVQEILSHNGDVLKFSGDAFLAMYKQTDTEMLRDAVHNALDCALVIQKNYGSYMTDVGVVIRVKLAISAGQVMFALIGDETTSHYVVVGKPIWDVKAAESISTAGDIMVSPAAWHYINSNEYTFQEVPDSVYIKLLSIGPSWRATQKGIRQQKTQVEDDNWSTSTDSADSIERSQPSREGTADEFSLRPAVNLALRLKIKEKLRRFIIAPVMKSIDMDEPFEYLTEMRQAVIVFINVVSCKLETKETVILADRTYKIVCRVVDKVKGCVNKVSLFDKDLMFVVIFGLRGLKHELECQVALRCARECHDEISKLPGVLSASIGVTTGKTYCGVFGHTLRREYTVISLIVNKAARLMVAYKNKVTCDRETFLHSKLEARHFILQEYKPLKGISHPGPVYEFRESELDHEQIQRINAYPILGRQEQLKTYSRFLERCISTERTDQQQYKMLLIKGDARQGKTRLLDEIVYITPENIPVNRITLTVKDQKIPYQTIRLIFQVPLGLTKDSSIKQKERTILEAMKKMQVPDLLCLLNDVFGVNFKNSELYLSMSLEARQLALKKIIKQLCYMTFIKLWVFSIDNCDFIDHQSVAIFDTFLEIKTIFIVGTMTCGDIGQSTSINFINNPRVKLMHLKPIEKYYLAALACQILDVYAISPELENAVQTRSNGNPGWIESFLISLIQDKGLYILKASLRECNDLGLVCPPLYMMSRLTNDDTVKWKHIMEERRYSVESIVDEDNWKKYIDSCRDSYMNVRIREMLEDISKGGRVRMCIISPQFRVGDEAELSMDALILKTFDSLSFFEQLLVKCSAILGIQFLRDMLLYVMSAADKRNAALAVKKLFEIKVLTCAKGDFLESSRGVFKDKLQDPNEDEDLVCKCRGLKIDESCNDLPRYASCGYMQFKSSSFREITYNLLTDNQKKEFHQRAIRYLERETRKCKACGNGYFERLLGDKQDKEFLIERDKTKKQTESQSISIDTASVSRRASGHSVGTTISTGSGKKKFDEKSVASFPSTIFAESRFEKTIEKAWFGLTIIKKLKNSYSLTRAFSAEDFTDCQCLLILSNTYAQMIDHCTGSRDLQKLLEVMLEYSYVSIRLCNIPLALRILEEALDVVRKKENEKNERPWKIALVKGKVHTLIGYARLELAQFEFAFSSFHRALREYGVEFPGGISRNMKTFSHKFKQYFGFYLFPRVLLKYLDHWETVYANNLAECLAHLCSLYMIKEEWKNAEFAATWCLSKALESFSDFQIICTAYANMLYIAHHFKRWNLCLALEVHALRMCHLKKNAVEAEDLKCVAKLYGIIFCSRIIRSNLERSIHMGYIVLRICASIRAVQTILPLLPLLIYALLNGNHFSNVYSTIQELEYFSHEDADSSGRVWYLALCICLQLETGYSIVPYHVSEDIYQMEGETWVTVRDPDSRKRFFTVMWLWCIRNERWEEASVWCLKSTDFSVISEKDSLSNKITALYLLEGMLLFLTSKLDRRNVKAVATAENEINSLISQLDKAAATATIILPRLLHLKAYFKFIKSGNYKADELLKKPRKMAEKLGNRLEYSWIDHSLKAWTRTLPSIAIDFWKEHTEADNLMDFQDIEISGAKLGHFTLPTPVYI